MTRPPISVCVLLSIVLLGATSGCGNGLATVKGQVTLDGEPVTTGRVVFYPVAGGATAYGKIGTDGTYRLRVGDKNGAQPGNYTVTVASKIWTEPTDGSLPTAQIVTPVRYARRTESGLKHEVVAGVNTIDLPLTSDP